jgi:tetratricopeptide (TPR) repeat protein
MALTWPDALPRPEPRVLITAAAALGVLVLVGGGIWFWQASAESQASAAYAAALTRAHVAATRNAPAEARATAVRELEATLASYPSAGLAAQAALELGGLRFTDGQYGPARSAYEISAARAGSGTLRALARTGLGAAWEAERNFANAAEAYRTALADLKPKEFLYEDTLLNLARVQELGGKKDDAIASYRRLLKDVPQTRRGEDVRARLASLGATP